MGILQDISTPAAVDVTGTTGGTVATASFSPPANSMVVIVANIGYLSSSSAPTVTCADSNAVSYTAGPAVFDTQFAGVYIFTHFYSSAPGPITVTVTRTVGLGSALLEIVPYVLTGANSSQTGAATLTFSTTTNTKNFNRSFTPTTPGSWCITGISVGNTESGTPTAVNSTTDHFLSDSTDVVAAAGGHFVTGSPVAANLGWTWAQASDYAWATLEILPLSGTLTPAVADQAAAADKIAVTVAGSPAESAGAAETFSVSTGTATPGEPEVAAAEDDISVAISQVNPIAERAAAADAITVVIGGAPAPTPGTAIRPANPAFIRSQMPRMHVQNLLTGAWTHRDVQGVTQPSITWALNTADAFTCTLAPPRADMMDSSGNALVVEWRDAIYLEESDEIKFGGICTQSTMNGPSWALTAMGFAGYGNGSIYEGADYVVTRVDALDAVRFMWNWLQGQSGSNIGLDLGTQKSGYLLGNQVEAGIAMTLSRAGKAGDTTVWLSNAEGLNRNETITINGIAYTVTNVLRQANTLATGQVAISPALGEAHKAGEPVVQQSPTFSTIARPVAKGANNVWLGTAGPFASGENITIGGDPYTIGTVATGTNSIPTGNVTISPVAIKAYAKGVQVYQVRTITPFELHWYNSTDIGSEMGSIRDEAIFDWREVHTWSGSSRQAVKHQLIFGVPRLGTRLTGLRFCEGENIVSGTTVTRDGTKYANNVIGLGAGSGASQIRVTASNLNTGRLRRSYVYTDQTANTNTRMSAKALKILTAMQNIDTVTQIVVKNHPNAPFGSFAPGDDIPVQLTQGWRNTLIWSRITQMTQDPTTDLMTLTLARSDSFTYIPDTGMAGSL